MKKKGWLKTAAVVVVVLVVICALFGNSEENVPAASSAVPAAASAAEPTPEEPKTDQEVITETIEQIVAANYRSTDVSVTVNEDIGTDADSDYIALVYLTWNVKNGLDSTRDMLAMYSEDCAARVADELPNVSELALFWTVPYYDESGSSVKYSYERRGEGEQEGMYQSDHSDLLPVE